MKALSVKQPWAWALLNGKPVENRGLRFPRNYFGPFLLHAAKKFDDEGYWWILSHRPELSLITHDIPSKSDFRRGGFVGKGTIWGYVNEWDSPWFCGPVGVLVKDMEPIPFIKHPGQLGLFNVSKQNIERSKL